MTKIKIRKAVSSDYSEVNKLVKEVHNIHSKNRPNDYKNLDVPLKKEDYIKMINEDNVIILVAEKEINELIGYAILRKIVVKNHNILCNKKILYIDDLCISENYRRQGLGKILFEKIKEYAIKEKCDSVELNVWEFNKSAIKFYKSLGMREKTIRYEMDI